MEGLADAIEKSARIELARRSFWDFCLYHNNEFFTKRPFLKEVADAFQEIFDGDIKALRVSMPPRAGKSYITSCFSAWHIGKRPELSVMRNTCTSTLYKKFSYDTRNIVKSPEFRLVFPRVYLSIDKTSVQGWDVIGTKQVSYFGGGTGGTIIGFGANVAITDDLYKGIEEALSDTVNDKTIMWHDGTHGSRFEKDCPRIDIGTRWREDDVQGVNIEREIYDKEISISALDENEKSFCEEVKTTKEYLKTKATVASDIWESEYMQNPENSEGKLFPNKDLKKFNPELVDWDKAEGSMAYVDIADEGADYHCCAIGLLYGKDIYIVDVVFTKANIDVNLPLTAAIINEWDCDYAKIETNVGGTMYPKLLRPELNKTTLWTIKNTSNKQTRILMSSGFVKKYFHFRTDYTHGSDYQKFMKNLCSYHKEGKNKHDDAPDTTAGLAKTFQDFMSHLYN